MKALIAVGALVLGVSIGPAFAEQAAPPAAAPPPAAQPPAQSDPVTRADLLLKLTQPPPISTRGSITRDDLQHVPPPRPDRLADRVHVTVGVGDPRCLPGDQDWVEPGLAGRRLPGRR